MGEWQYGKNGFEYKDNSEEISDLMKAAIHKALIRIGMQAESFAKKYITMQKAVDTGYLRNSIKYAVHKDDVYIGTNVGYAPYVELGTGKYYDGGRKTAWAYQDAKGDWHMTHGQRARPYLKPAAANHTQTYKNIVEDEMKNG